MSSVLRSLLEPLGGVAEQEVSNPRLGGPTQEHAEHAAGVGLERVGGPRPPFAEVLEGPRSGKRLGLALLLDPSDRRRLLVREAQRGANRLHLCIRRRLCQRGPLLGVPLEDLNVLERALPLGGICDVGGDLIAEPHLGIDLDGALTADGSHGPAAYAATPLGTSLWRRATSSAARAPHAGACVDAHCVSIAARWNRMPLRSAWSAAWSRSSAQRQTSIHSR